MVKTRLQDEYNKLIKECDIFIALFYSKVGQYTEEEFDVAFGNFAETNRPLIYTYFKPVEMKSNEINDDIFSLLRFQEKLKTLGHFYTHFDNEYELKFKIRDQLTKLISNEYIVSKEELLEKDERSQKKIVQNSTGSGDNIAGDKITYNINQPI